MEEPEDDAGESSGSGVNSDMLKSYLAFARRALRAHRLLSFAVFTIGVALTFVVAVYFPRTYVCKTVLMAQDSTVLDKNNTSKPLSGAESLIMRHENLEAIIRDIGLVRNFELRRPPLLKLKDRAVTALVGPMPEKVKVASLVGSLESAVTVTDEKDTLEIKVSWSDGQTAAEIAEAARESYLKSRHTAEISAFEDKMAILDGHASKLRDEVGNLADQMNAASQGGAPAASASVPGRPAPARVAVRGPSTHGADPMVTEQLSSLREKLATDKAKLSELESDWHKRLNEEQSKLSDLKLRLTPNHPEVVTQQERVTMLSSPPAEVATLHAEVSTLTTDIRAAELITSRGASFSAGSLGAATEPLPTAIIQALEKDDVDPALRAQLSGAIVKYGELRNDILSGRVDLDTAQAAFTHRYQIIVPAEAPTKPTKPKPGVILGAGLFLALILALLLPIVSELRKGVIVETWQVQQLQLPVLAELRLPPRSD